MLSFTEINIFKHLDIRKTEHSSECNNKIKSQYNEFVSYIIRNGLPTHPSVWLPELKQNTTTQI